MGGYNISAVKVRYDNCFEMPCKHIYYVIVIECIMICAINISGGLFECINGQGNFFGREKEENN